MIRTALRLGALVALAAVALAGCGNSPLRSGAAAIIGDTRISSEQLAGTVEAGLADPQAKQSVGSDPIKFQRDSLARLISHVVLQEAARRKGVTVTEGQVDTQLAAFAAQAGGKDAAEQKANLEKAAAQGGVPKDALRPYVRDIVVRNLLGDALTTDLTVAPADLQRLYTQGIASYDQVHTRHILVAKADLANQLLAQIRKAPDTFAALAAQNSTDTSNKAKGGDLGFAGRGSFVAEYDKAAFAAKPGDTFVVKTQFGFHVVQVLERRTTTLAEATPMLRRQALAEPRATRTETFLRDVANSLGVTVNPRFGRWDAKAGGVTDVPVDGNSFSSPQPAPGGVPRPTSPIGPSAPPKQ